ncbi:MAG TPA: glycosyltransferase family 4 protein [Steroidobacteraceae bacterium]|nr:glycosyltransferase family 4 protein [Steroidobacteraceae bacterium]
MIRILHMTSDLSSVGGTARKLMYLIRHSDTTRFQHCFIAMQGGEFADELQKMGSQVTVLESNSPWQVLRAAWSMIRSWQPDVIATHFTRSFACGTLVARWCNLPVIHHEHGPATLDKLQCSPVKQLGKRLRRGWLPGTSAIICNSHYTAEALREMYVLDAQKIKVIHNPVERRSHETKQSGIFPTSAIRIGHVGGLVNWRDQKTLIRAVKILKDQGCRIDLRLVGNGPMRAALRSEVEQLDLSSNVTFMNFQSDLTEFYSSIDIYINPALAEGFGIAVVEAMLESKPVILARAGAHPELIQDGVSGVLYEAGNAADLARKVSMLADAPKIAMTIADEGCRHAMAAFAAHKFATAYQVIIEDTVSAHQYSPRNTGRSEKLVRYG